MSRTVTVTFDDGSTQPYAGIPDSVTPDDVITRAEKDFPSRRVVSLDGHRKRVEPPAPPSNVSVSSDVAQSIVPSAVRGVTNLLGTPADVWGLLSQGAAKGSGYVLERLGLISPETKTKMAQLAAPELPLPTGENIRQVIGADNLYKPQTRTGKIVGAAIEGAAATPVGRTIAAVKTLAMLGGAGGTASEVVGQAVEGSPSEGAARIATGFAVPLALQGLLSLKNNPAQMIREATGKMTPEDFADAQRRLDVAKALGISLAAPEVLPVSSIQQLMSDVAASKGGGQVVNAFMANRPAQIKNAVQRELLDPIGAANTPDRNMAVAKDTATQVVKKAEQARTAAVDPLFKAARADVVPESLLDDIAQKAAAQNPFLDSVNREASNQFLRDLKATAQSLEAPNNAAALGSLYRSTRTKIDSPDIGASSAERATRGTLGALNQDLRAAVEASSPNFAAGNRLYQDITASVIDPLTAGPVGRVAGLHGFDPSLPPNLNPVSAIADAKMARPESIKELYSKLNAVNPEAFPSIARTWLENAFDAATQRVQAGENRMIGANFAKGVYGTDQQIANFAETMRGVALSNGVKNADEFVKGAKNLMEVLQMTGKVPNIGSPTGGRLPTNEMAQRSNVATVAESISTQPFTASAKALRVFVGQRNYKKLAEILTDPNSVQKIEKLGKYNPSTTTAQALAVSIITSND